MARPLYYQAGPNERFAIITGDGWWFDVVPARNAEPLARRFDTRLEALEDHLSSLETEAADLKKAIARAKSLRRAWNKSSTLKDRGR